MTVLPGMMTAMVFVIGENVTNPGIRIAMVYVIRMRIASLLFVQTGTPTVTVCVMVRKYVRRPLLLPLFVRTGITIVMVCVTGTKTARTAVHWEKHVLSALPGMKTVMAVVMTVGLTTKIAPPVVIQVIPAMTLLRPPKIASYGI